MSFVSQISKNCPPLQLCPNTHLYMAVQYTLNHYTYFNLIISILFITGKHLICQKKKFLLILFDAVILIRKPTNKIWDSSKCYAAGKAGKAATMNSHFRPTQVIISKVRSYKTTSWYVSGLFMSQPPHHLPTPHPTLPSPHIQPVKECPSDHLQVSINLTNILPCS